MAANDAPGSPSVYLVKDLERACIRLWGSEKEFRREQLRREIQRRYLLAKHRFGKDSFFFGKSSPAF